MMGTMRLLAFGMAVGAVADELACADGHCPDVSSLLHLKTNHTKLRTGATQPIYGCSVESPNPDYGVINDIQCPDFSSAGCGAGGLPPQCRYCSLSGVGSDIPACVDGGTCMLGSPNPKYGVFNDAQCKEKSLTGCAAGGLPQHCRYCSLDEPAEGIPHCASTIRPVEYSCHVESPSADYGVFNDIVCPDTSITGCAAGGLPPQCRYCSPGGEKDGLPACKGGTKSTCKLGSPNPKYGVFNDPKCDTSLVGCAAGGLPMQCRYCSLDEPAEGIPSCASVA